MIAELKNIDAMTLLASLDATSVDAIITDPPYGTTNAAWDKTPDWPTFFRACWRVLKKKRRAAHIQPEPDRSANNHAAAAVVPL